MKRKNITPVGPVRHTLEWFQNRLEKLVYRLVNQQCGGAPVRKYIKIQSPAHAKALFFEQNNHNLYYYEA